jgi:hypothetical protein
MAKQKKKGKVSRKYVLGRAERILKGKLAASKLPANKFFQQDVRVLSRQLQRGLYMGRNYVSGDYNYYGANTSRFARYADYELMDREDPIISSALDQYASNVCIKNDTGETLMIQAENANVRDELDDLFSNVINIAFELPQIARGVTKFGDYFALLTLVPNEGVTNYQPLNSNEVEREETFTDSSEWTTFFKWIGNPRKKYKPYEMAHFRIINDSAMLPFGRSMIDAARRPWKQLRMLEDAMLIYKVTRAPETRVFYIDIGNTPPEDVETYVKNVVSQVKRAPIIDESGNIDLRFNPMSVLEDFVIPVRGDLNSKIEVLPGVQGFGMDELNYILNRLFAALKIPKAYLGYDDEIRSKATLVQEDSRFAIVVERIQNFIISELDKIAMLHLYLKGFSEDDLAGFTLSMTKPSAAEEAIRIENMSNRINLISTARDSGAVSIMWLQKNVLGIADKDIAQIVAERLEEADVEFRVNTIKEKGIRTLGSMLQSPAEIDRNTVRELMRSIRAGESSVENSGNEGDMDGGFGGFGGGGNMGDFGDIGGEDLEDFEDLGGGDDAEGGEAPAERGDAFDRVFTPDQIIPKDKKNHSGLLHTKKRSFLEYEDPEEVNNIINRIYEKFASSKKTVEEEKDEEFVEQSLDEDIRDGVDIDPVDEPSEIP